MGSIGWSDPLTRPFHGDMRGQLGQGWPRFVPWPGHASTLLESTSTAEDHSTYLDNLVSNCQAAKHRSRFEHRPRESLIHVRAGLLLSFCLSVCLSVELLLGPDRHHRHIQEYIQAVVEAVVAVPASVCLECVVCFVLFGPVVAATKMSCSHFMVVRRCPEDGTML